MKLKILRILKTDSCTIGELYIDDNYFCDTLEDKDRGLTKEMSVEEIKKRKVKGSTCIPSGEYDVTINYSPRFKINLPLICDVPGFSGIRMHPTGNSANDTEGCILIGKWNGNKDNWISDSKITFNKLFTKLKASKDKITITINNV